MFQKKKYIWSATDGDFQGLDFPGEKPTDFGELSNYTGLNGESEIRKAKSKYGYNRYIL